MSQDSLAYGPLGGGSADAGTKRGAVKVGKAFALVAATALITSPLIFNAGVSYGRIRGAAPTALAAGTAWTPAQPGPWEHQAFEASIEFRIPYMGFVEPLFVHSDKAKGLMRLSYWNGANVILVNTTGSSFELVPVNNHMDCLITNAVKAVELVIPDLELFRQEGSYRQVPLIDENGMESVGYEFTLDRSHTGQKSGGGDEFKKDKTPKPAADGFQGKYVFVVNATAGGHPVSVDFIGHNPFLVASHNDHYTLLYKAFYPRPEGLDSQFFMPPQGEKCTPFKNPTGPFAQANGGMRDIAMMFPGQRGDSHRAAAISEMWAHFNKSCSGAECGGRQQLALRNYQYIQSRNRLGLRYKLGLNHMLDWTPEERKGLLGGRLDLRRSAKGPKKCGTYERDWDSLPPLPQHLDLRESGLVGPPRDQGTCGSCWSFSVIGMIEGQVAKTTGRLTRMSEQHLVDCSWPAGNLGCDGGDNADTLEWALNSNQGDLPTSDSYGTYLGMNGFCHFDKSEGLVGLEDVPAPPPGSKTHITVGATIKSCWHVAGPYQVSEQAAITQLSYALVSEGPISVYVDAGHPDFSFYSGGVYDNPDSTTGIDKAGVHTDKLDHLVLATGFGLDQGDGYWWIRNSWSTHWGESGYIRIAQRGNIAGIMTAPAFARLT